jgi:altronate hydrolase
MNTSFLKIHAKDNVIVALSEIRVGTELLIDGSKVMVNETIPQKHKLCINQLEVGEELIMYGVIVAKATIPIKAGDLVSTTNVAHQTASSIRKNKTSLWNAPDISSWKSRHFMGFHRADGQVGTANNWLFFPLVFCENRNIEILKDTFEKELFPQAPNPYRRHLRNLLQKDNSTEEHEENTPHLDQVNLRFITHQGGCGGTKEDAVLLARLLAGYVNNPNVAGATVLSLGCQHLQIEVFKEALDSLSSDSKKPVLIFEQQQMGTTEEMLTQVIEQSYHEIQLANQINRAPAPLSKLTIGLECGGSDGFSGISANPTLGYVSDVVSALGGSSILAEFPELCGVEQDLVDRCVNDEIATKFLTLMQNYDQSAQNVGSGFDMNPSPGNVKDGLITDAIKSAGAAKKGGTSPIVDVLDYTEYVSKNGLNLLCTPGNDVESTTAMVGSGANLVLFTTGLGTPTGNPITPVLKIASNTDLCTKMPDIIDFDTGAVIRGEKSIEEMGELLLEFIIEVASGRLTINADRHGQFDFIPWKRGVSL